MSTQKAKVMLEHLKLTHQFFCFGFNNQFFTAEELLSIIKGRAVSFNEAMDYITQG